MAGNRQFPKIKTPPKMPRAKKTEKNPAPKKSGRGGARPGAGAPKGNKNAKGHKRPQTAGRQPAAPGDPRNIKINIAINRAEAALLDAKAATAGLSRADLIRALIST